MKYPLFIVACVFLVVFSAAAADPNYQKLNTEQFVGYSYSLNSKSQVEQYNFGLDGVVLACIGTTDVVTGPALYWRIEGDKTLIFSDKPGATNTINSLVFRSITETNAVTIDGRQFNRQKIKSSILSSQSEAPLIQVKEDLKKHINARIRLIGTYHDPGKGSRYIDCGFTRLNISDYSFYTEVDRHLVTDLKNGQRIEVETDLKYYPGNLVRDSGPPVQEAQPPIKVIDGKKYKAYPPEFYIVNAKVLKVLGQSSSQE